MTHSDKTEAPPNILKRDARRRVRTTAAQRAAMLAEYACSGLSGPAFARVAGVNYQTFACWRQQQRKAGAALLPAPGAAAAPSVRWVEAALPAACGAPPPASPLQVTLPGGAHLLLHDAMQVPLAAQLIRAFA